MCVSLEYFIININIKTLYANDASRIVWIDCNDGESTIRPKSNGQSIMISGFLCACHGFLCREINGNTVRSYKTIKPGKNRDGFWTNENLVQQLEEVIPLFKSVHPDCELLFAFDNSQNHHAKASDALVASRLNKSDGGVGVKVMRDTSYNIEVIDPITNEVREVSVAQEMFVMHQGNKIAKGVQRILTERGLWDKLDGRRKLFECGLCKAGTPPPGNIYCCGVHLLSEQPDFKEQLEMLQEVIKRHGDTCKIIYFPKYHCELNYIEVVWGYLKNKLRRECTFSFPDLCDKIDQEIMSIPLKFIRRIERYCFRFMDGYRHGLKGPLLDYAMKRYSSHRKFPFADNALLIAQLKEGYEEKKKLKIKLERQYNQNVITIE